MTRPTAQSRVRWRRRSARRAITTGCRSSDGRPGPDSVRIDGDLQAVIDREIAAASHAGLDYWAFMGYAPDDPMTNALDLYLSSARRGQIGFCMIGSIATAEPPDIFPAERAMKSR